jgi:hypothetical protein
MRRFYLERLEDVSGVSGTGVVVEGVEFSDGTCAYRWISNCATTVIADSIEIVERVHGHDGRTVVRWLDKEGP